VQTFVPFPDFRRSAQVLDDRRLGKQRVEALQIARALTRPGYGWRHHPAVRMWRGHPEALARYAREVCDEWRRRGHPDTCLVQIEAELDVADPPTQDELAASGRLPAWVGDDAVHRSHRSALVRKDPEHYRPLVGDEPDDLPYVWPPGEPAG
jgi:hypothetical protein